MELETSLRNHPPMSLRKARIMAHKAVQLLSKAARANLPAEADDSHSNMGWDAKWKQFLSQPIASDGKIFFVAVSLSSLDISLICDNVTIDALYLGGVTEKNAAVWLDSLLERFGLKPASGIILPYELPPEVAGTDMLNGREEREELSTLSAWFDLANAVFTNFAGKYTDLVPGPSPVRCWPHHFDIATYVSLEAGDFETAKGVGIGLSPGDESYDQPYFYINPWPHLDVEDLPKLPDPGHWHKEDFVGAIATADEVLSLSDITGELPLFIDRAFNLGREKPGV